MHASNMMNGIEEVQASAVRKSLGSSIFLPFSNVGSPRYGQVAHRKASPSPHCKEAHIILYPACI